MSAEKSPSPLIHTARDRSPRHKDAKFTGSDQVRSEIRRLLRDRRQNRDQNLHRPRMPPQARRSRLLPSSLPAAAPHRLNRNLDSKSLHRPRLQPAAPRPRPLLHAQHGPHRGTSRPRLLTRERRKPILTNFTNPSKLMPKKLDKCVKIGYTVVIIKEKNKGEKTDKDNENRESERRKPAADITDKKGTMSKPETKQKKRRNGAEAPSGRAGQPPADEPGHTPEQGK